MMKRRFFVETDIWSTMAEEETACMEKLKLSLPQKKNNFAIFQKILR